MAGSIRARAKLKDEITQVKALIKHPMETGARLNKETQEKIPAHFIRELSFTHNDKVVMSANWSGGISQDPFCSFKFKGGKKNDVIVIQWKDNLGNTDKKEVKIK